MKIVDELEFSSEIVEVPLFASLVRAGAAQFADDYVDTFFSLDASLVKHSKGVFCVKVSGDSMVNAGIFEGDILIVDTQEEPSNGKIIIASVENGVTVKRLMIKDTEMFLLPANPKYDPIRIDHEMDFRIVGVVTHVIKKAL
ncbi:MAG: translesion error-prone DNA polymerase V autoproteolytic subunit [Chloroherpetonaceae bacterium]|nr:translesion error-prone DNA polymerase V autoproteolytic subunit [Chloroherpetonaceae bacterium]